MLWQPSLPERYLKASPDDLARDIAARRAQLGETLVILGHHYQTDEIIRHADFTGDSLKLSQTAADVARTRDVRYVIFCGVHFMAETADMLTPEHVDVILPDLSAGCSMADMAAYEDALEAWDSIHESLRARGWRGRVIPITYVNSTAAIKAFVGANGGACCTSSNADKVFAWAMAGGDGSGGTGLQTGRSGGTGLQTGRSGGPGLQTGRSGGPGLQTGRSGGPGLQTGQDDIKILFLPDQHLGRNTAAKYGLDVATQTCLYDPKRTRRGDALGGSTPEQLLASKVVLWAGHCSVHKLFRPEHCDQVRAADAQARAAWEQGARHDPEPVPTTILVHPECVKEVVDKADLNGSTEFIIRTLAGARPGSRWAIGTEVHLVTRIARAAAARGVHARILSDCQCLCTTMYRIDQPHMLWVLDGLVGALSKDGKTPKVLNTIKVHPEVRRDALAALERMLRLSPTPVAQPTSYAMAD